MNIETGKITICYKNCGRSTIITDIGKDAYYALDKALEDYVNKKLFNYKTFKFEANKYSLTLILSDVSMIQWQPQIVIDNPPAGGSGESVAE